MSENDNHEPRKRRTRGVIACSSCRRRRVKCVKGPQESTCEQCRRNQLDCVVSRDDRKQETSRAYLSYLEDRVDFLARNLQQIRSQPLANEMPQMIPTFDDSEGTGTGKTPIPEQQHQQAQLPIFLPDDTSSTGSDDRHFVVKDSLFEPMFFAAPQGPTEDYCVHTESPNTVLVNELLSTTGHLKFDRANGRWRYFGPTTNFHYISSEGPVAPDNSLELTKHSERVLRYIPPELHDHLLESYWIYYNPNFQVVDCDAFQEDQEHGRTEYYSGFLHVTMLAIGLMFAEKSRPDVQKLQIPGTRRSLLHQEAKYLAEYELDRPGGLPSIQALLLLSSLESGCGRDNAGWMYAGMSFRLAFDIGLNLEGSKLGICREKDLQLRHKLLRSCVLMDMNWSLFLGRRNSIKLSDLPARVLTSRISQSAASYLPDIQEQIFAAFLALMVICSRITEQLEQFVSITDCNSWLSVAALEGELHTWHSSLPEQLVWNAERAETAPLNYFLLHQTYHCAMILLFRPFTHYEMSKPLTRVDLERTTTQMAIIAREVCCDNTFSLAQIFRHFSLRCEPSKMTLYAVQHVGAAVAVLIAALRDNQEKQKRPGLLPHLLFLAGILRQMATTYNLAEKMSITLDCILDDPLYRQESDTADLRQSSGNATQQRRRLPSDLHPLESLNENYSTMFGASANLNNPIPWYYGRPGQSINQSINQHSINLLQPN